MGVYRMSKNIKEHEENYWHIKKPFLLSLLKIIGIFIWIAMSTYCIYSFHKWDCGIIVGSSLLFTIVAFGGYILGKIPVDY